MVRHAGAPNEDNELTFGGYPRGGDALSDTSTCPGSNQSGTFMSSWKRADVAVAHAVLAVGAECGSASRLQRVRVEESGDGAVESTTVIAGGRPAGMMAGLLARAGIAVTVLEEHADFLRDLRGGTVLCVDGGAAGRARPGRAVSGTAAKQVDRCVAARHRFAARVRVDIFAALAAPYKSWRWCRSGIS